MSWVPIKAFVRHWLNAVDEHSLHSPFLFDFYIQTIKGGCKHNSRFDKIESLRHQLLNDKRVICVDEVGSGSTALMGNERRICDITRTSISSPGQSCLYYKIARHIQAKVIVELGTSFGINTLYLAESDGAQVHTFEGVPAIIEIAELTFEFGNASNIKLHNGLIDQSLPRFLGDFPHLDLVIMDANHRFEPMVQYFRRILPRMHERSVLIVDDIHRSLEMERAWNEIKANNLVYTTADLYHCGIAFFDPSLTKQHVVLQF